MNWVKAEGFKTERGKWYVVWTNGEQWRDQHIHLYPATLLEHHLRLEIVRGRPLWVAEVTTPGDYGHNYNGDLTARSFCGND